MAHRKPAETRAPVHDLIRERWSPHAFRDTPVPDTALVSLFEAARWAPSCLNRQPWRFIVATAADRAAHERLLGCYLPFNQDWARFAPVLMLVCAEMPPPDRKQSTHYWYDTGLAVGQLTLQATALGLVLCQMQGIDYDKARAEYALPERVDPICGLALGYQGDPDPASGDVYEHEIKPRDRNALGEFVFEGVYGKAARIAS